MNKPRTPFPTLPPDTQDEPQTVSGTTAPDFLERFTGVFADDPTFAEAVRLGRAWRDTEASSEVSDSA